MNDYKNYKKKNEDSGFANAAFKLIENGLSKVIGLIFTKNNFVVYPTGELTRMWNEVENHDAKMAVIEADKLVDVVLKRAGVAGESLGERLRHTQKLVRRNVYNDMWEAHKVRNQLVHEMDHGIDSQKSAQAIWKMKKYLVDLGAFKNE